MALTYISLTLCGLGVLTNILNVAVFCRKSMRTPVNLILLVLAVVDIHFVVCWSSHKVHSWYHSNCGTWTSVFSNITLYHLVFLFHTFNVMATMSLSVIRYVFVCRRQFSTKSFTYCHAKMTMSIVAFAAIILNLPTFLKYTIEHKLSPNSTDGGYCLARSEIAKNNLGVFTCSSESQTRSSAPLRLATASAPTITTK